MRVAWGGHGTGRGWETPPPGREGRGAPRRHTSSQGDRTGEDGGGDARVGAGEAMGEEEWVPGQSCSMLGDRMGLGFSCFPFLSGRGDVSFVFPLFFPVCWWCGRSTMTGQAGPGAKDNGI